MSFEHLVVGGKIQIGSARRAELLAAANMPTIARERLAAPHEGSAGASRCSFGKFLIDLGQVRCPNSRIGEGEARINCWANLFGFECYLEIRNRFGPTLKLHEDLTTCFKKIRMSG